MNVTLTPESEAILARMMASGAYSDASEAVNEALLQCDRNLTWLQAELEKGEQSGEPVPFDLDKIKKQVSENIKHGVKVRQSAAIPPIHT